MTGWHTLGGRDPLSLAEARLQIHWAAQPIAAVGMAYGEPAEDDSHTNMEWLDRRAMLAGQVTARMPAFRLALDPAELTLMLLDLEGDEIGRLAMDGHTVDQGYEWLEAMIGTLIEEDDVRLDRPTYDLPGHAVGEGGQFAAGDAEALAEVGRWFANANLVLRDIQKEISEAGPVRCWPHHFDIATLIQIDADTSIGIGMTPGDGNYGEPYWYVTPWPYPEKPKLPDLAVGEWHTEGWIGAVLTGTAVVAAGDADAQRKRSEEFLEAAIGGCKTLLGV